MEFAKHIAVKSKKQLEADMEDLQKELEEMSRVKQEVCTFASKIVIKNSIIISSKSF